MFRRAGRFAATLAALAVVVGLTAAPAAASTWTVKIGTTSSGSGGFVGTSGSVTFKDIRTSVTTTCNSTSAQGAIAHLGSGLTGTNIITTTSTLWSTCVFGSSATVVQSGNLAYNAVAYNTNGLSTGTMSGWNLAVSTSFCSFHLTGTTDAVFNISSQVLGALVLGGSPNALIVSSVTSGCSGLVANGDQVTVNWGVTVSAHPVPGAVGTLFVTSP